MLEIHPLVQALFQKRDKWSLNSQNLWEMFKNKLLWCTLSKGGGIMWIWSIPSVVPVLLRDSEH